MRHHPEQPITDIIFDLNGTLLDMQVLSEQNKHLAREHFGRELTDEQIRACWGRPAEEFYPMLFGDSIPWEELRRLHQGYDYLFPRRLLPGVKSALDTLRGAGIRPSIVTSGKQDRVHAYARQAGLDLGTFALVYTEPHQQEAHSRSVPVMTKAIRHLGISAAQALIVGDEPNNMLDAVAAGTDYALITRGTRTKSELLAAGAPADRILSGMNQLAMHIGITASPRSNI